jgi:tetratricopeptide (TPR) repeat protein
MKRNLSMGIALAAFLASGALAQETNGASSGLLLNQQTEQERIDFLLQVAGAYYAEKEYASAIGAYERVLEIDPTHQQARYVIGHVYINAKEYAKAEEILSQLVDDYPEDFTLLNNLAWLYATAEDPAFRSGPKAVELAQKAMVLAPGDHHVWSTLAEAHYISGDYEKAYRAINNMAKLAARYGKDMTKESVDDYNEQIRKCKRAWDTQRMIEGKETEEEPGSGTE